MSYEGDADLFPDPSFNMLISGVTACGKTRFVLDLLKNEFRGKLRFNTVPDVSVQ